MNMLKVGDKVAFIINSKLKTGIINSILEPLGRAYVQSDGISLAIDVRRLAPVSDIPVIEEKKESKKTDEITIRENQLIDILTDISFELTKDKPFLMLPYILFGAVLTRRLFGEND